MKKKRRKTKGKGPTRPRKTGSIDAAVRLHKSGKLVAAEKAYRRVLRANPRDPHTLYLCGVVTAQLLRPGDAIELLKEAVSLQPDHQQSISELAKLYQETGLLEESANALRQLIDLRPDLGELHSNLAIVLDRLGKPEEAAAACQQAIKMNPERAETHSILGDVLKKSRHLDEAAASYRRAIALNPKLKGVFRHLIATLRDNHKHDEIADVLKQWLEHEPDSPVARHLMSVYSEEDMPQRASDDYVRQVFDEFAATFEDSLRGLDYQGPRLIGEAVEAELDDNAGGLDVLDAGCGTGLCGPMLRPIASRLIGVDLSAMMIQRARELDLYDDLVEGELTAYLKNHPQSFDLIVATDTFNYFGDLEPLLDAASRALKEDGILLFTMEHCDSAASAAGYRLNQHGRYSHSEDYVGRCMTACGLSIRSMELATLRRERDQPVAGIVVRARKSDGSP